MRKFISIVLVMLLTFSLTTGAYASEDPTQWKQHDQAWGNLTLGENGTMKSWGCLITSIAIQMARANTEESTFTPGTLRNRLEASGFISHSHKVAADGNLSYAEAFSQKNSPNFYYCGAVDWSTTQFEDILINIEQLQKEGYFVVAQVKFGQHYVACGPVSQFDVTIYDPGYNTGSLKAYNGGILGCIYFKSDTTSEQSTTQVNGITITNENAPSRMKAGSPFSLTGNISSESSLLKHVVVGVYSGNTWITGKCSMNICTNAYDIAATADLATRFDLLTAGNYTYRVIVVTESGERIVLLESPFSVY